MTTFKQERRVARWINHPRVDHADVIEQPGGSVRVCMYRCTSDQTGLGPSDRIDYELALIGTVWPDGVYEEHGPTQTEFDAVKPVIEPKPDSTTPREIAVGRVREYLTADPERCQRTCRIGCPCDGGNEDAATGVGDAADEIVEIVHDVLCPTNVDEHVRQIAVSVDSLRAVRACKVAADALAEIAWMDDTAGANIAAAVTTATWAITAMERQMNADVNLDEEGLL